MKHKQTCQNGTKIYKSRAELKANFLLHWTIGVLGFDSLRGLGFFFFTTTPGPALGPIQLPI